MASSQGNAPSHRSGTVRGQEARGEESPSFSTCRQVMKQIKNGVPNSHMVKRTVRMNRRARAPGIWCYRGIMYTSDKHPPLDEREEEGWGGLRIICAPVQRQGKRTKKNIVEEESATGQGRSSYVNRRRATLIGVLTPRPRPAGVFHGF